VCDVVAEDTCGVGFAAEYSIWSLGAPRRGFRTGYAHGTDISAHTSRPIDHWVISYCRNGSTAASTNMVGAMTDTGPGQMLADYMLLLERNLPNLSPEEAARLPKAIQYDAT
jgi:hypothetical protein